MTDKVNKKKEKCRIQLNIEYSKLIAGIISKFKELGITIDNPDSVMNPLRLSLEALEKDYIKNLKSL